MSIGNIIRESYERKKDWRTFPSNLNIKSSEILEHNKVMEYLAVNKLVKCKDEILKFLVKQKGNINLDNLKEIMKQNYSDPNVMSNVKCVVDSLFYLDPSNNITMYNGNDVSELIQDLLCNYNLKSRKFVNNYTSPTYKGKSDMFYIKLIDKTRRNIILNELLTGIYITNSFREFCPNFAYVYGGFSNSNKEYENLSYILYENIDPNFITLTNYIRTCTRDEFLSIYVQVILALKTANKVSDFTHYNLHTDNVIIRHVPTSITIPYKTLENEMHYLTTNKVATIIDYSYSHSIYTKKTGEQLTLGNSEHFEYSVDYRTSSYFHDIYKLLMYSAYSAKKFNRNEIFNCCEVLFKFFNNEALTMNLLEKQKTYFFSIPRLNINPEEFIKFIFNRDSLNLSFLSRNNSVKNNLQIDFFKNIGVNTESDQISDLTSIADLISTFYWYKNDPVMREVFIRNFKPLYPSLVQKSINNINEMISESKNYLDENINNFTDIYSDKKSIENLFKREIFEYIRKMYDATLKIECHIESINIKLNHFSHLADIYNDLDIKNVLKLIALNNFTLIKNDLNYIKKLMKNNNSFLTDNTNYISDYIKTHPDQEFLSWYLDERNEIYILFKL